MRRLACLALAALTTVSGCSGCFSKKKTDAELAAEERGKAKERIEKSIALVPYRSMKTMVRGHAAPETAELKPLWTLLVGTQKLAADAKPAQYVELAVALYQARDTLKRLDEDQFPLLWTVWVGAPPVIGWYDAPAEHLALGTIWLILDAAAKQSSVGDMVFYELSRAETNPAWPWPLRLVARGARGGSYLFATYYYAAEEELNGYLAELERLTPADRALLATSGHTGDQIFFQLRAAGHFLRAWNRIGLERDDPASEDVEAGLADLQKLGFDNELTQWGWAFVHYRHGRYAEAGADLEKLAQSPHLDAAQKAELLASAEGLKKKQKGLAIFRKARAATLLSGALIARLGGLQHLLELGLGPDSQKIYAPLAWLDRLRTHVTHPADPKSTVDKLKSLIK